MTSQDRKLQRNFFSRNAKIVAQELLGKILVRRLNNRKLKTKIVETEAYFGEKDPASRARQNGNLRKVMEDEPGIILVYGVHNNWLINFITGKEGKAEAVLIRALEPLNFKAKTCGPGLLTKALSIDKGFHHNNIINNKKLWLEDTINSDNEFEIVDSFRVGIKKDLPEKLRFYIKDNPHVSKK